MLLLKEHSEVIANGGYFIPQEWEKAQKRVAHDITLAKNVIIWTTPRKKSLQLVA